MEMGKNEGFYSKDYNVGVVSIAFEDKQPDLGIWIHGDVVEEGSGWAFEPYNATIYKNRIIGRGATDNKGQFSAIYNLFKIFKELDIKLNYNPALYVGSNEETGMADLKGIPNNPDAKGFINVCTPPRLSLVPDGRFSVGYGAKGNTRFYLKSKTPLSFSLTYGQATSPGLATAIFDNVKGFPDALEGCVIEKGENIKVTAFCPPRHGASPSKDGNALTILCSRLLECDFITESDKKILKIFKDVTLDIKGETFNVNVDSQKMSPTVVSTFAVNDDNNYPELSIRVIYPIEITHVELENRITAVCNELGFEVEQVHAFSPYLNDIDNEVVKSLNSIANEITGRNGTPYVNGATYAHLLPNAYIYGMEGNSVPDDFTNGRGGAHGVDECVSIERLKIAMRIYARALLRLNEIKW
jgi:succinyl-diaminopimelate desuccinylase